MPNTFSSRVNALRIYYEKHSHEGRSPFDRGEPYHVEEKDWVQITQSKQPLCLADPSDRPKPEKELPE